MSPRKQITYSSRPNHAARAAHRAGERQFRTYDTSPLRPRHNPVVIVAAVLVALLIIGGLGFGGFTLFRSCTTQTEIETLADGESVTVTIASGSGAKAIAAVLLDNRVISNKKDFVTAVQDGGYESSLKPGDYIFTGPVTLDEVIALLVSGPNANALMLTIPEGYTLASIASAVEEVTEGTIPAEDFTAAATNASAYEEDFPFVADAYNGTLEGFLFPKTYAIADDETADSLIRKMLKQYKKEVADLDYSYAEDAGLSAYDVLILASIVEKEAAADNRATVASVFYNRLSIDMALQSDATTAYEIGADPTAQDVATDGVYNTYTNKGLTPSPICSPGLESIQAVLAPESTNYLYFYFATNDDGELVYSFIETYDQHLAAINGS